MWILFQIAAFRLHLQGLCSEIIASHHSSNWGHESGSFGLLCGSASGPNEASGCAQHVEAEFACRNRSHLCHLPASLDRIHPDYELAAAPRTPSIEAPLDEDVDVFTLSHRCRAGMTRRMVDQVGLIVGRTNEPKPTLAQLCGRVPRARKALFYRRPSDFPARQDRFPSITQEHRTILPHELLAASQPHSAWRCGTLSATFAA